MANAQSAARTEADSAETNPAERAGTKPAGARASRVRSTNASANAGDGTTLVIVESPAKAKTISQFLGRNFLVEASFGHVRDLPNNAAEIPEAIRKEKWARLGVNPQADFEPVYIIPDDKRKHVAKLKGALKEASGIMLATDEDREGESISWHLLQVLKPPKNMPIQRIVFHEITREALLEAVQNPRELDEALVRAQESRRILDRLYGYTLSPLLWRKVAPRLSAGRVQSVATRLLVERERQRQKFKVSTWWDLETELAPPGQPGRFRATLVRQGQARLASGRSFDANTGELKEKSHLLLDLTGAKALEELALRARPWTVTRLEHTPGTERPVPPFTTSTLQQEANRKLRFSSKRTMQLAQGLYEGIELGRGERVGLITYMRTDSLTLSEKAISEARQVIQDLYGEPYLPPHPVRYKTSSRNAQEAHEAIRPTDLSRRPQDVRAWLDDDQYRLYEMIWKRTIACQMVPAQVRRTSVEITVDTLTFAASGKQIVFPGFLRAYVEGSDDPDAELSDKETMLPLMELSQELTCLRVTAQDHSTRPPARYTEASLVQKLEQEGIGRPSTYATIMSTIQERGYAFKRGNELVPTFTAFCVTEFLEKHFRDLVEVGFTSRMEEQLDDIADGQRDAVQYLRAFYQGEDAEPGLVTRVEQEANKLEFPRLTIGEDASGALLQVRMGRFGPYIQRGEGGENNVVSLPDDLPPAELTPAVALELLERKAQGPNIVARDPESNAPITLNKGRFGDYLEMPTEDPEKPRRTSLPKGVTAETLTEEVALQLMSLPRSLGTHPESGLAISTGLGRFGPFIKYGAEYRSLKTWEEACSISLEDAVKVLAAPKAGRGRSAGTPTTLRELGDLPGCAGPVKILDGRYGPYITDSETNAPLPKGVKPEDLTAEEALLALATRRSTNPKATKGKKASRARAGAGVGAKAAENGQGTEDGNANELAPESADDGPSESGSTLKRAARSSKAAPATATPTAAKAPAEKAAARKAARGAKKSAGPAASQDLHPPVDQGQPTAEPQPTGANATAVTRGTSTTETKPSPKNAEPKKAERTMAEPKKAETGKTETGKTETGKTETEKAVKKGDTAKKAASKPETRVKKQAPPPPPPPPPKLVTRKTVAEEARKAEGSAPPVRKSDQSYSDYLQAERAKEEKLKAEKARAEVLRAMRGEGGTRPDSYKSEPFKPEGPPIRRK